MADNPKDKHGFWSKILSELYKVATKELESIPGRINILMMIGLLAIILLHILSSTATSIARIIASIWNPAFISQTDDNILALILTFFFASIVCLVFMKFIIKEDGDE